MCVFGVSDASYHQEELSVCWSDVNDYWKSGVIRKVCTSPKAMRTRGVMKVVDDACNASGQLGNLLNERVELKIFMDSRPLLESIGSSSQVAEKVLRQSVNYLKQGLEDGDVSLYGWIEGKDIVTDILTKQGSRREVSDKVMTGNAFRKIRMATGSNIM